MDSVLFLVDDLDAVFDLTALEINKIWLLILNLNLKVQENQAPEQENEKQTYIFYLVMWVNGETNRFNMVKFLSED